MKIQIASDLHVDINGSWKDSQQYPIAIQKGFKDNVLVIAGDMSEDLDNNFYILTFYAKLFKAVIFVLGNHEYYSHSYPDTLTHYLNRNKQLVAKGINNIHILEKSSVQIDDVTFYGCTGWGNALANPAIKTNINDFKRVRGLTPELVTNEFNESVKWVKSIFDDSLFAFSKSSNNKTVLVTHFGFCEKSALNIWEPLDRYFTNAVLETLNKKPNLYIHGHTHRTFLYEYDNTQVVCNPFGYTRNNERGNNYHPDCVVEI